MTYTQKRKITTLYKKWLPENYATVISKKIQFSEKWIREVRYFRAENQEIETALLRLVKSQIKKHKKKQKTLNQFYGKSRLK